MRSYPPPPHHHDHHHDVDAVIVGDPRHHHCGSDPDLIQQRCKSCLLTPFQTLSALRSSPLRCLRTPALDHRLTFSMTDDGKGTVLTAASKAQRELDVQRLLHSLYDGGSVYRAGLQVHRAEAAQVVTQESASRVEQQGHARRALTEPSIKYRNTHQERSSTVFTSW